MASIFLRSLALAGAADAACVTNASRTPADGTFAVASRHEGVIQVYAASCAALLHEFATIHPRVHALHYTSFSDSLVTLESDRPARAHGGNGDLPDDDEETFLCVYHDWRERNMVRGYTLPLGVLDTPSTKRKADCVAVCSYTGRVVVAMGSVLNIWQCSQGFFEHVMEIKVDMTQLDAYHVLEYVAIHGVYVAFGSSTEVRVMEVHVHNASEVTGNSDVPPQPSATVGVAHHQQSEPHVATQVPEDDVSCVHFDVQGDLSSFESIPIPLASYGEVADENDYLHLHEKSMISEYEESPVVLDRNEAQQEELNLAGLIKMQDIRVNQAMNYHVAEGDVRIILRRYLPPNQRIQMLKFLPETIDNHVSLEARSYTRLLVGTVDHAFLYYFLSSEADVTRKRMVKKVLGKGDFKRQSSLLTRLSPTSAGHAEPFGDSTVDAESSRVVMHYAFSSPVTSITANSSFLFVTSSSSLQVWSIWSPCHHLAATRMLNSMVHQEPTQPQLISVEALHHPVSDIAALDGYVVVLPREDGSQAFDSRDFIRTASAAATELLPPSELEMRGAEHGLADPASNIPPSMLIIQQSPPSAIFSLLQSKQGLRSQTRVDLLLSLYSLYRYRADVGANVLAEANEMVRSKSRIEAREALVIELETRLYDRLARDCAAALATEFISLETRDLSRAALFFVESKVPPSQVMERFQKLMDKEVEYREQIVQATHKYLEARVFQTADLRARRQLSRVDSGRTSGAAVDGGFTQSVVSHYVKHTPDQLPRLVIDSNLAWTLEDLHFGFETLKNIQVRDVSLVNVARLVLTLRAQSLPHEQWESCRQRHIALCEAMEKLCSYEALCRSVERVARDDAKALIQLCVSHPDLLVNTSTADGASTASLLSQALLARSPTVLAQLLEAVFDSAVNRRESILGSVILCVKAIGDMTRSSLDRISSHDATLSPPHKPATTTRMGHYILLRFICYVLDTYPRLYALAERDELSEDDEELLTTRRLLAMEMLHVCVVFVSTVQGAAVADADIQALVTMFPASKSVSVAMCLPEWEAVYLETWCTEVKSEKVTSILRYLLQRALLLLHEPKLVHAKDILTTYERIPVNDFGRLLVLLTLPSAQRTVDGLRLLAERDAFVELFLPYGKCYCSTLEEWKCLIETLSALSDDKSEAGSPRRMDELGVLESVLSHVCSTLGPEDLLEVLPDEGDLAMFMATIEASVRLEDARAREATGVAVAH